MNMVSPHDAQSRWAVIPVKRLALSKSRLAGVLSAPARAALQRAMLADVLKALKRVQHLGGIIVVSDDRAVGLIARQAGALFVAEKSGQDSPPENRLNQGISLGLAAAARAGAGVMAVFPADIPFLCPGEIDQAFEMVLRDKVTAVIPDASRDGTNGLIMAAGETISPAFGPHSFARHMALPWRRPAYELPLPSAALDVDSLADLRLAAHYDARPELGLATRAILHDDIDLVNAVKPCTRETVS